MKKFKIEWSNKARIDFQNHFSFILNVSYDAAKDFADKMYQSITSLEVFPQRFSTFDMCKMISCYDFRKMIVNNRYIVIYGVSNECVKILRILDARKKFETLID